MTFAHDSFDESDIPSLIENWRYIGTPPESELRQFALIWHLEFVLRHFVYAGLRVSFGLDWIRKLEIRGPNRNRGDLRSDALQRQQTNANLDARNSNGFVPSLIWFLTLGELGLVIDAHWKDCFCRQIPGCAQSAVADAVLKLRKRRNAWAHFYSYDPKTAIRQLNEVIEVLGKPLQEWIAQYWNADPVADDDPLVGAYREAIAPGEASIPLLTRPTPGLHGGFAEPSAALDRGWVMLLLGNAGCYWVEIGAAGVQRDFGLPNLIYLGRKMQDCAIHVATLFHEKDEIGDPIREGFFGLRVSLSKKDGLDKNVSVLRELGEFMMLLDIKRPHSTESSKTLSPDIVHRELFYKTPWNVIVAPNQEHRSAWMMHIA